MWPLPLGILRAILTEAPTQICKASLPSYTEEHLIALAFMALGATAILAITKLAAVKQK